MITIEIAKDSSRIEICGHACYSCAGQDIVCAGVSSLYYALLAMPGVIEEEYGEKRVLKCSGGRTRDYVAVAREGWEMIAQAYPDNVKVIQRK